MLISRKLLNRYVEISDITSLELANGLTNAGLEVEGIDRLLKGTNLAVGYVVDCVPHSDSDHLNICQVDLGDRVEQIVCGANNIRKGIYVCVAQVGAILPGDFKIKASTVRGVASNGMICSLSELGVPEKFQLDDQKEGIVVLPEAELGSDPAIALGLDDEILDVSQTPNRSDFMSIFAVAHEVSAIFERPLTLPEFDGASQCGDDTELIVKSETDQCPYFMGKVINHVTINESPLWIREALIGSGIKPINNVVDISNLVMLETGQPLHFYDIDFLKQQELTVIDNFEGTVAALDGEKYDVIPGDLMIMNGSIPVGIAGIMGLGNSMIHSETRGIIIESARFNHVSVRKTSLRLGINSESSQRFTKPLDNYSNINAMNRAVSLLKEYANARQCEETVAYGELDTAVTRVVIELDFVNRYLGTQLSHDTIINVFERLNFNPIVSNGSATCTIPSYRKDISIAEDLVEEVIRIVGYDALENTLPLMDLTLGSLDPFQKKIRMIESHLLGFGLDQILSYTLVDYDKTQGSESIGNPILLANPISDKRAYLRTQLLPSMVEVLSYNTSRKNNDVLYFEHSALYAQDAKRYHLGIIGQGALITENWTKATMKCDFFTVKGMILDLMDRLGFASKRFEFKAEAIDTSIFHPYQSASIYLNRKRIGVIGQFHPNFEKSHDLKNAVYAELDLSAILEQKSGAIKSMPISKHPEMSRDLSVLCKKDVSVQDLIQTIEKASRRYLVDLTVFDVFTSEKLGDDQSISFKLYFGQDRTLEVDEINEVMTAIQSELVNKFKVEIR